MVTLVNEIHFFGFVNPVGNLAAFWKASLSGIRVVLSEPLSGHDRYHSVPTGLVGKVQEDLGFPSWSSTKGSAHIDFYAK